MNQFTQMFIVHLFLGVSDPFPPLDRNGVAFHLSSAHFQPPRFVPNKTFCGNDFCGAITCCFIALPVLAPWKRLVSLDEGIATPTASFFPSVSSRLVFAPLPLYGRLCSYGFAYVFSPPVHVLTPSGAVFSGNKVLSEIQALLFPL